MTIEDLFRKLSYGELSNLAMAVEATGTIKKIVQPRIVNHANEALTRLYSRFNLSQKDVAVPLVAGTKDYALPADLLLALEVYDAYGNQIPLNEKQHPSSVFVHGNTLTVPSVPEGVTTLQIVYQARHPELVIDPANIDLTQQIDIPVCLEEAVTAFVGAKIYAHINTQDAQVAKVAHATRFEEICQEASLYGFAVGNPSVGAKFRERGWV